MNEITEAIKTVEDVQNFVAALREQLDRCDNGEGLECVSLDASLELYAGRCCTMIEHIKRWGRDVFSGRIPYDQSVDDAWFRAGVSLNNRAVEMLQRAQIMEVACYDLVAGDKLRSALFGLYQLLDGWVRPQLSIGPSARQAHRSYVHIDAVQERIGELLPLPKGWAPTDPGQSGVFRKASKT